eukprot:3771883-Amphidinium_carterae.1
MTEGLGHGQLPQDRDRAFLEYDPRVSRQEQCQLDHCKHLDKTFEDWCGVATPSPRSLFI